MKKQIIFGLLGFMVLTSCNAKAEDSSSVISDRQADDISLSAYSLSLGIGETFDFYRLNPSVPGKETSRKDFFLTNMSADIISINEFGVITALSEGKGYVQVGYQDIMTPLEINVSKPSVEYVLNLIVPNDELHLLVKQQYQLHWTATLNGEEVKATANYGGFDETVISVNDQGIITALKAGETTLSLTATHEEKTATKEISLNVIDG